MAAFGTCYFTLSAQEQSTIVVPETASAKKRRQQVSNPKC